MKTLNSLVRLHKFELDEKRQELGVVESQIMSLEQKIITLEQNLIEEVRSLSEQNESEVASFIPGYIERVRQEQNNIKKNIAKLEVLAEQHREKVLLAFQDFKKFEKAREMKQDEIDEELKHKEQNLLDELSSRKHSAGSS